MDEIEIVDYRGIENLVYAKVIKDTLESFETGTVKRLAGVAELTKSTESSSATKYYDNVGAIVNDATGPDEVQINTSAIPLQNYAEITGQYFDEATGMVVEGPRNNDYFAIGYETEKTDGTKLYVWRLKGKFNVPDQSHKTKDDGTDSEGQELTYTGIETIHKFTKTGKSAKSVMVPEGKADVSTFFDTVQTPDTVKVKTTG